MKLDFMEMLYALSLALDMVENEAIKGAKLGHGKRVGYLCYLMGKKAGLDMDEIRDLVGCGILHDNALTEYFKQKYGDLHKYQGSVLDNILDNDANGTGNIQEDSLVKHCIIGERRMKYLPFHTNVDTVLLYHHENADGSGPMGKKADEITLKSQILRLADRIDIFFDLTDVNSYTMEDITEFVKSKKNCWFSEQAVQYFLDGVTYEDFVYLKNHSPEEFLRTHIHVKMENYSDYEIRGIARFFAEVIDYKSSFTKNHSLGVAQIAETMAEFYGFDAEKKIRFYMAGALHDIGKLLVPTDILEKPGKLEKEEFFLMKNHASATYRILRQIHGIEDITEWAANHHEKLDGSGYPRGLTEKELTFEDKLMACIDIYQALREDRPYKKGMDAQQIRNIMYDMVQKLKIDREITADLLKLCCD